MKLGEIGLLTNDVVRLADFYRMLFGIPSDHRDPIHQTILDETVAITIYNDGTVKNNANENICLAFTVEDVDKEYERLRALKVQIAEPPQTRPWGARNMSFYDPDGNRIYLRSILPQTKSEEFT